MCLPFNFLQTAQYGGSIAIMFISVVTMVISLMNQESINKAKDSTGSVWSSISFGFWVLLVGVVGFCGMYFQKRLVMQAYGCCLMCSGCFYLIIFLFLFSIGIVLGSVVYCIVLESDCSEYGFERFQQLSMKANSTLCSRECICYINPSTEWPSSNYLSASQLDYTNESEISEVQNYQNCVDQTNSTFEYLHGLEMQYECAGWCESNPIYLFSSVSRGAPRVYEENGKMNTGCFKVFTSFLSYEASFYSYFFLMISIFFCFVICLYLCFIFHPDRRTKTNYRMYPYIDYDRIQM